MIVHAEILVVLLLSGILGPVVAQGQPERKPAEASPAGGLAMVSPEPNPDIQAIGDLLGRFIKAYNAKDAKALGELFTREAEIEDEDGEVTRGRDAIVVRFAKIFGEGESGTLGVTADSLRFLGTDIAIEEGTASISTGADTPPRTNRYSVIYARQGGRWLHARVRRRAANLYEWPPRPSLTCTEGRTRISRRKVATRLIRQLRKPLQEVQQS